MEFWKKREKTYTFQEIQKIMKDGKNGNCHFKSIETAEGEPTGRYRLIKEEDTKRLIMDVKMQRESEKVKIESLPNYRNEFVQTINGNGQYLGLNVKEKSVKYGDYQKAKRYNVQDWIR